MARTVSLADYARQERDSLFLSEGEYSRLNQRSVRVPRRPAKFEELNTAIVGCSADSVEAQANFKEKHKLNFPLLARHRIQGSRSLRRAAHEKLSRKNISRNFAHHLLDRSRRHYPQSLGEGRRRKGHAAEVLTAIAGLEQAPTLPYAARNPPAEARYTDTSQASPSLSISALSIRRVLPTRAANST